MVTEDILAGNKRPYKVYNIPLEDIIYKSFFIPGDYEPMNHCKCRLKYDFHPCSDLEYKKQFDIVLSLARSDERYELILSDIKLNGIKSPLKAKIYKNRQHLVIIDGHHRLAVAQDLDMDTVPVYIGGIKSEWWDLVSIDSGIWPKGASYDLRTY